MPVFLSLYAGIGGFDHGLEASGWTCAGQIELDPFCWRVLATRWPESRRWRNARRFKATQAGRLMRSLQLAERRRLSSGVRATESSSEPDPRRDLGADSEPCATGQQQPQRLDLLCAGFPCQDFSVAGKRAGLVGIHGTLFWEIVRIAKLLRPPWGLFENVPGLLSSHRGRDFWAVLQGLRECWPVVGWRVLDSQHFGVPQRRRRVF